jgi:ribosome-associated protein YbcJ (S4-like RNA binding protein)
MPSLIIKTEETNQAARNIVLSDEAIIGREKSNNVFINDQRASRQHAKITRESDGSYMLVDLGSRNGIMVNGERVSRRRLVDNDRILIGQTSLIYTAEDIADSLEPAHSGAPIIPLHESEKAGNNALKQAIQKLTKDSSLGKRKPNGKKSGLPGSANTNKNQASGSAIAEEVIADAPSFFNRIIAWLAFLIFFAAVLFFSKEMTKRWLFKMEKSEVSAPASLPINTHDK